MPKNSLSTRIFIGLFAGLVLGVLLRGGFADGAAWADSLVTLAATIGSMFVNLIMLLVVPLVFVSIISGMTELPDSKAFGRLGGKTFGLYIANTLVAISVALIVALLLQPGVGAQLPQLAGSAISNTELPNIAALISDIIPRNPFQAFADGNMLQIIFMALLFGFILKQLGKQVEGVAAGFRKANLIMMALISMVMRGAPIGVFALMVKLGATLDASTFTSVIGYIALIVGLLCLWMLVVYPTFVSLFTDISAAEFRTKTREQMLFAFSCASSNASIPVTMRTLTEKLGVSKATAGFGVPLGATMNMGGVSIYITIAAFFLANAYGAPITTEQLPALIAFVFLLSVGAGGVPGGGAVMIGVLIHQMGLPVETAFALIIAVDRIIDMFVTAANVVGDAAVVTMVDRSEREQQSSLVTEN
ncbi:dicarboxylate/amino acid:cation symporter [Ferrimonas lipolytica]|uniref:Dicarboxylate/amino acid:cation symporter n=1 Tax=Ferrimonas lipolytica TaxID=2724191 RepID=A0A6H1UEG1_9GAMM|nr:dicarboxylate/amino acid:cation symporter [Ferrimonas lipolytica]QIZ77434.1 dicarboxylate/amino acid:cation symporter [Ferrimonas lipolytica]